MKKSIPVITFLSGIIMTILYMMGDALNSYWPRILITLMFYIIIVWIRITRWWNIVFDVALFGVAITFYLLFDSISLDMKINLFILFAIVSGLYFIALGIAKIKGYPLIKEDSEETKKVSED